MIDNILKEALFLGSSICLGKFPDPSRARFLPVNALREQGTNVAPAVTLSLSISISLKEGSAFAQGPRPRAW